MVVCLGALGEFPIVLQSVNHKMPHKNRITPKGEFVANPCRCLFMGNRGILHDSAGRITHRRWAHNNWIICLTNFKERKRQILSPSHYTELFFLDEVTALAAGHRPCCECRREAYRRYWDAFRSQVGDDIPVNANALDKRLQAERAVKRQFKQRSHNARLMDLPSGTIFQFKAEATPMLRWRDNLYQWSFEGYAGAGMVAEFRRDLDVDVMTPPTTVLALRGGYAPVVHPSAQL